MQMVEGELHSFELQRLHGMGDLLYRQKMQLNGQALPLRVYAPVGVHRDLLPYLVRRFSNVILPLWHPPSSFIGLLYLLLSVGRQHSENRRGRTCFGKGLHRASEMRSGLIRHYFPYKLNSVPVDDRTQDRPPAGDPIPWLVCHQPKNEESI
jgi:hypothetical protein